MALHGAAVFIRSDFLYARFLLYLKKSKRNDSPQIKIYAIMK